MPLSIRSLLLAVALAATCLSMPARADDIVLTCAEQGRAERPRFTVDITGTGPDVILVPGLATPGAVWDGTRDALRADFRVHVVSVRGFSSGSARANREGPVLEPVAEGIADYLRECGIKRPALVGHSLGALMALMVATRHPDLPGRVVAVDGAPFIGPLMSPPVDSVAAMAPMLAQMEAGLAQMRHAPRPPVPDAPGEDPGERSQAGTQSNTAHGRTLVAGWVQRIDMGVFGQMMVDALRTDLRAALPGISAPVDLIYAQDDRRKPAAEARAEWTRQYAGTPDFHAAPVPGSYHFVMLDQPAAFHAALVDALRRPTTVGARAR